MNLQALTDEDLAGLRAWTVPLARMDDNALRSWGGEAWHAVRDEERRREADGPSLRSWPSSDDLSNERLVLLSELLAGIHQAGSPQLAAFVEELHGQLVNQLRSRSTN